MDAMASKTGTVNVAPTPVCCAPIASVARARWVAEELHKNPKLINYLWHSLYETICIGIALYL